MTKKVIFCLYLSLILINPSFSDQPSLEVLHLNLKKAMQMASEQNAQVLAAHQRVLQALANISVSNAALLPQLSGTFGGKRQTMDLRSSGIKIPGDPHVGPFNSFDARGKLTMEIFDPEAVGRLKSAKAGGRLSQAQSVKVKQDILALVGSMFLEAERAQQSVELTKIALKEADLQVHVWQQKFKQGLASQSDLNKATADLASVEYSYETTLVHADQTRLDLCSALKIPLNQTIIFDDDQDWVDRDLQQTEVSPDERVAQAQLEQSQFQAFEVKRSLLPRVTAAGDFGRQGESFSASSNTYSLGVSVDVPVWEGGSKQAKLKQTQAKIKEDEALLSETQDQAQIKMQMAFKNLTKAKAFLKAKIEQLNYAASEFSINQNRLKTGLGDQLDSSHAESLKALALDDKNEAQALYWTAKINLAHEMGRIEEMFSMKEGE